MRGGITFRCMASETCVLPAVLPDWCSPAAAQTLARHLVAWGVPPGIICLEPLLLRPESDDFSTTLFQVHLIGPGGVNQG